MNTLLWIVLVIVAVAALVGLFAAIRHRQRSGAVMASRPANNGGGTQ